MAGTRGSPLRKPGKDTKEAVAGPGPESDAAGRKGCTEKQYICGDTFYAGMILVFRHFFYRNYVGLSLWPFIFLRHPSLRADAILINHERIHLRQQAELLLVFFYLWYLCEWLVRSLAYRDFYKAYQNISFEREAYSRERELDYLGRRPLFRFLRYLYP